MNPVESPPAGNSAVAWKYETWVMMVSGVRCPPPPVRPLAPCCWPRPLSSRRCDQFCSDVICSCSLSSNNVALPTAVACDVTHVHLSSFPLQTGRVFSLYDIFSQINRHDWTSRGKVKCSSLQLLQWLDDRRLCFPGMCANVKQHDYQQTAKRNTGKGKKRKKSRLCCLSVVHVVKNGSIKQAVSLQLIAQMITANAKMLWRITELMSEQNRTAEQRAGEILPCTCQPEMMADFLWAGEALIVSSWTEKNLHRVCECVCVFASKSRKLYTYMRSEDDLNICEFLCSPGVGLSQQKNCWPRGVEKETRGDFMSIAGTFCSSVR